jgi:hypothetical protein
MAAQAATDGWAAAAVVAVRHKLGTAAQAAKVVTGGFSSSQCKEK